MPRNSTKPKTPAKNGNKPTKLNLVPGSTVSVPIDAVYADPNNENAHPPEQIEMLRYLYREFGQQDPAVCMPDGMLKSSHGWWTAMKLEGAKEIEVKVTTLEGWKADAYRISNNQSSKGSDFRLEMLATNINLIQQGAVEAGITFDPRMLAFYEHQLQPILAATWTPPPIDGSENDPNKRTDGVPLTAAIRVVFEQACAAVRAEKGLPDMSEPDCLEQICRAYLDDAKLVEQTNG